VNEKQPEFAAASLNVDDLRGRLLLTFPADRFPESFLAAIESGTATRRLDQAIAEEAGKLASELSDGIELRGAAMSVGRGAGTVLPAIEIWRVVTDEAVRITFWVGGLIAFAKAVKRVYGYLTKGSRKQRPLVSPEVLIQLSAAEVFEAVDAPRELHFGSITSVGDLHHVYSTSSYVPYDYGDVFVVVLTAGADPSHIYGFVWAADGTMIHRWHVAVDFNGHPAGKRRWRLFRRLTV
jgi:hypothetical protein